MHMQSFWRHWLIFTVQCRKTSNSQNCIFLHDLEKLELNILFFSYIPLFRNKRFMLDKMAWRNASKFTIFLEYENPCICSLFRFSFCATLFFPLMNVLVWHRSEHSSGEKIKYLQNEKKNYTCLFIFQKYSKFWNVLPIGHFIKHKPLIFKEWSI